MVDIWQQEKNLTKAAKVLGESKSQLHTRETTAKTKVLIKCNLFPHEKSPKARAGNYSEIWFDVYNLCVTECLFSISFKRS